MLHFQIFPNSLKSREVGIFVRIVFQAQHVCKRESETQFLIKLLIFLKKKCSYFFFQESFEILAFCKYIHVHVRIIKRYIKG